MTEPALIDDHVFEPWTYTSGLTICIHWDQRRLRLCERPAAEHAQVPAEASEVGGDPGQ